MEAQMKMTKVLLIAAALSFGSMSFSPTAKQHITFTQLAHADDAVAPAPAPAAVDAAGKPLEVPAWVAPVLGFIQGIPTVGPILSIVLQWMAFLAAALTALSGFLMALKAATVGMANLAGLAAFADKAEALFEKILPWVKYFSMFNVQKK